MVFITPLDINSVNALSRLKSDLLLCKEYGENGYKYVKENFDRKILADKYIHILEEDVIKEKKQRL
ncbi:MAG: hypothetical protein ACYSSI_04290 [Planctomycetota bacterium]|jgi:glycosyltransferase involved in cell wall biosynthesis